ncbi:NAD-dependent epimerase/dehydratase family protein [uncultured Desulfobacter sp.]|uniref:NAD-dependent epimerase/dehydratase family protein n=1 Tax=uncultured Desulfobacter sp. TaxID=240139 RepID=UPI002AAA8696|nr:NAD-dependent epimerase/dehydratase family protein [uncultured Desulfobacter sp.]
MKNQRIFISGGAGVVGRELVAKLHGEGASLLVGDLKPVPKAFDPRIQYRQGDLNYISREELDLFKPDVFIHLAATFERSIESYEFWEENFRHNIALSHHLMTLLKGSSSLKRVIFPSSYLVYSPELYTFDHPREKAVRLVETDKIAPRNLIGSAKLFHEMELNFLNAFCKEQFSSVMLRIFRGYGRGSRCVISRWVRALLNNETIQVYNKKGLFDYIYAGDIAQAIIKVLEHPELSGIVNLGTDNARTVADVVNILKRYFPGMDMIESDLDIPYEASQANMDLFKRKTGWLPETQLEDAIPKIIEYEKQNKAQSIPQAVNVLVTSASGKIPLIESVKKGIRKIDTLGKVIAADADHKCLGAYFADGFWHMPPIDRLSPQQLTAYCKKENISAIIPTRDGELEYFSKLKQCLEKKNIRVMISGLETITTCGDKLCFYTCLKKNGLPAIPTFLTPQEVGADAFVVKERFGTASSGVGINLTMDQAEAHARILSNPVFQPFIKGVEISVDIYIAKGGLVKGMVMRTRDEVINGESRVTTAFYDNRLAQLCERFAAPFEFYGHIILQVIQDNAGDFHIIECNPRFGGASTLGIFCGLDSFYWFLLESRGADITDYPFVFDKDKKIKQVRYPKDKIFIEK